ncbi:hypothetical protein FB45DRAFT_471071 [Roridomyces roridus]|uniref:Uncharacterized protein n=1 Tax=Roridomyces roridus TaxID=1738132 RepID=A0AAD7BYY5_9AGAR|nr:hypothetical protein FB45DRAFT_471071 [Roridomyces roridus]
MPDPPPLATVAQSSSRSTSIYKSAEQLYALFDAELAHHVRPYELNIHTLNEQLSKLSRQLETAERRNAQLSQDPTSSNSPNAVAQELAALKSLLNENGMGVVSTAGRPELSFVGDHARLASQIDEQAKHFVPDPTQYKALSPSSFVSTLTACITECSSRLKTALTQNAALLRECIGLKATVAKRDADMEAATQRWETQRVQLETSVQEEKKSRGDLEVRLLSLRAQSDKWKSQYESAEAARDTLKTALDASEAKLGSTQTELDTWKDKCLAAEADLKTAQDESNAKSLSMQAEIDKWKNDYLAAEGRLEKDRVDVLGAAEERNTWKELARTAGEQRDTAQGALRDANEQLDASKTELAEWEAKGRAWDAERTEHEDNAELNAKLTDVEAKLLEAEMERDQLQATLTTDNTESLARNTALMAEIEELKKKKPTNAKTKTPKTQATMFINKPGVQLPGKPGSSPAKQTPSSSSQTQDPRRPVVGFQAGVAVRRGGPASPAANKNRSNPPPTAAADGLLAGAAPISRAPALTASVSVDDSTSNKRPALSSQSNTSLSPGSLKRVASSPLLSEPAKSPRTSSAPQARPVNLSTAPTRGFTKPPTPIIMPSQLRRGGAANTDDSAPRTSTTRTRPAPSRLQPQ